MGYRGKGIPRLEEVRKFLTYDPGSGVFTRIRHVGNNKRKGSHSSGVGSFDNYGYHLIFVCGGQHRAHKLAWLLHYGEWPTHIIDHINGDRADSRIANLRACSHKENMRNRRPQKNNELGVLGVHARTTKDGRTRYVARVWNNRRRATNVGVFDTLEEAVEARSKAASQVYGAFAPR